MTKKHILILSGIVFVVGLISQCAYAWDSKPSIAVGPGIRIHNEQKDFAELPFGDGDVSYLISIEGHDPEDGYWQLAIDYAPDVSRPGVDYVLTPQLNLNYRDRIVTGGIGILKSFIESTSDNETTDLYWQLNLGLLFELPWDLLLTINSHYIFEDFGSMGSDFGGVEFSSTLTYRF